MKYFFLIIWFICFSDFKKEPIVNRSKDGILKYSAYSWHINHNSEKFEFYLAHFIEINRNGEFITMRHDKFMDEPKFYSGIINKNILKVIDSTLNKKKYRPDYSWKVANGSVYDGFTYCFDIRMDNKDVRKKIQFIPPNSPMKIRVLASLLDSVIFNASAKSKDTLNLKSYSKELIELYKKFSEPLPKITKFRPPQ